MLREPERERAAHNFTHSETTAVLLCDQLGGEGRSFQAASWVVHVDLPWDLGAIEQRIGRLDRMGREQATRILSIRSTHPVESSWSQLVWQHAELGARWLHQNDVRTLIDLRTLGEREGDGFMAASEHLDSLHRGLLDEVWSWEAENAAEDDWFLRDRTLEMYERFPDRIAQVLGDIAAAADVEDQAHAEVGHRPLRRGLRAARRKKGGAHCQERGGEQRPEQRGRRLHPVASSSATTPRMSPRESGSMKIFFIAGRRSRTRRSASLITASTSST